MATNPPLPQGHETYFTPARGRCRSNSSPQLLVAKCVQLPCQNTRRRILYELGNKLLVLSRQIVRSFGQFIHRRTPPQEHRQSLSCRIFSAQIFISLPSSASDHDLHPANTQFRLDLVPVRLLHLFSGFSQSAPITNPNLGSWRCARESSRRRPHSPSGFLYLSTDCSSGVSSLRKHTRNLVALPRSGYTERVDACSALIPN
jgi:hypothetical protein